MNILDKIVADKLKEVQLKQQLMPVTSLEKYPLFERKTASLASALKASTSGIIAEHKRRSPSKEVINQSLNVQDVASGYEQAGACGMSVLTDAKYFGGSLDDLLLARAATSMPLLRKEFIIDPYQIVEAKAYGADVILLIAAILTGKELKEYAGLAKSLGLEVLLEVHDREELECSLVPNVDMLGVNNRNLKTFEVSTDISKELSQHIPGEFVKVSESGIGGVEVIKDLKQYGYRGFLIGENFMRTNDPGFYAKEFINDLNQV
ncbi:indole-3-glycerol phosphate synthase TrpC [Antarcticibacterium flavum]|uniref:Indole-3-glycerol phosphate synthase n=1 Tax=Antarcticibacterium flavum TaxID=2058175 RepID=A0A5B7X4L7_9FLAO|nr:MULTISPECIES: indole-3-glycerol phosphate synthase TrpC [Antarcticibacterium]MCM4159983.1 indole-3-glycerol phosphate synthase TrpC [Antarcticibacterium sp. W02-3]QCY70424.1 indole-3-glycerol phosphate synthase TrpC [Antarcticibacterium flavum]